MAQQNRPRQDRQQDQRWERPVAQLPSKQEYEEIMINGNANTIVTVAERIGKTLKDQQLTSHQIRNIFGAARQIQMRWDEKNQKEATRAYRDAVLLKPKLAYFAKKATQRDKPEGMETLQNVLEPALGMLQADGQPSKERYDRFMELFEAIVAYHTKHGGK